MKEPRILDLHEITVIGGRQGFPTLPRGTVQGRPACEACRVRPCELKWRKGGYPPGGEVYKSRCYQCRRVRRRYSGPDVLGSRDFPCEGHRWTRCSVCPRDPVWAVAANRLTVLPLYRLGVTAHRESPTGEVRPWGPVAASFRKSEAVDAFGPEATARAWRDGLTAFDADEWAPRLIGHHALNIWPQWEALVEAEAAAGRPPEGGRTAAVSGGR
jgi:hypothetical protein